MPTRGRTVLRLILTVCLTSASQGGLAAQATPDFPHARRDRLWVNLGLGLGQTWGSQAGADDPTNLGVAGELSLTYQPRTWLLTARMSAVTGIVDDTAGDIALLFGVGTRGRKGHLSLAAGPVLAEGAPSALDGLDQDMGTVFGLGLQIQALTVPFEGFGFGLTGFANLNRQRSFGGLGLTLAFGRLIA